MTFFSSFHFGAQAFIIVLCIHLLHTKRHGIHADDTFDTLTRQRVTQVYLLFQSLLESLRETVQERQLLRLCWFPTQLVKPFRLHELVPTE